MREHLAQEIVRLKRMVSDLAAQVEHAVQQAVEAAQQADETLARRVIEQDDAIDAFLQKRFRGRQPDRTEIRRAADALLRRGHAWGDIRRALERYDPDLPEE